MEQKFFDILIFGLIMGFEHFRFVEGGGGEESACSERGILEDL